MKAIFTKGIFTPKTLIFAGILSLQTINAQQVVPQTPPAETTEVQDNTIKGQFELLIEKSNNWEQYKVVPKVKLNTLKKNVQDSLALQRKIILQKNDTIKGKEQKINGLQQKIGSLEQELSQVQQQRDSISFFGMEFSKAMYSSVLWGVIASLAALLFLYIFRFFRSNAITRKSVADLEELRQEYEEYRTKAIEREQKVGRLLQDEINKNRGI